MNLDSMTTEQLQELSDTLTQAIKDKLPKYVHVFRNGFRVMTPKGQHEGIYKTATEACEVAAKFGEQV